MKQLRSLQAHAQYLQGAMARTISDLARVRGQIATHQFRRASDDIVVALESSAALLQSTLDVGTAELARATVEADRLAQVLVEPSVSAPVAAAPVSTTPSRRKGKFVNPVDASLTSEFGERFDPFYKRWQLHAGIDLAAGFGTQIRAAAAGVVMSADWNGGYGNYTCISHGVVRDSSLVTCYAHQSEINVSVGDQVAAGQPIGLVGSTGASTGPHLHFEVRIGGEPVDPLPWL